MVMVGDSPVDAETAARAGATFVLARYGFGAAAFTSAPTTHVADSPRALAEIIRAALEGARHID